MLSNRIEEASSVVTKALEESNKTWDLCSEGRYDLVKSMVLVLHDRLLIAANTLHAIKDFIPHLALNDEKKDQQKNNTVYHLPPIR